MTSCRQINKDFPSYVISTYLTAFIFLAAFYKSIGRIVMISLVMVHGVTEGMSVGS